MSKQLKEFCKLIGKEYSHFLYQNDEEYPFCCHTSANLISSYLSVHFDESFIHRKLPSHGVSMGNDCVIDFTDFQNDLSDEEKDNFRKRNLVLSKDQLYQMVKRKPIYETKESTTFQVFTGEDGECGLFTCKLYCQDYASKIRNPYTLEGFMQYIEEAFKYCKKEVTSDGLYNWR